jgi:hypothetical protein
MLMPPPADVTFVVQGPISTRSPHSTRACTRSIREHFPGCPIVLSTWEGSDVSRIDYDQLVFSADPGATHDTCLAESPYGRPNSINRMIVSTRAGLLASRTLWSVRTRSDFVFTAPTLLALDAAMRKRLPAADPRWQVFSDRILCPNLFSIDTFKQPIAYHPSDMLHVGRTADLCRLWDAPLMTPGQLAYCRDNDLNGHEYRMAMQFTPEQWIWLSCLSRAGTPCHTPLWYYDFSSAIEHDSLRLLLSNFIVVDYADCGVTSRFDTDVTAANRAWDAADFAVACDRIIGGGPSRSPLSLARLVTRLCSSRWRKWLFHIRVRRDASWIRLFGFTFDFSAWTRWPAAGRRDDPGRPAGGIPGRLFAMRRFAFAIDVTILGVRIRLGGR